MTNQAQAERPASVPATVWAAVGVVCLHTLSNTVGGVLLLLEAKSAVDHNQDHAGPYAIGGGVSLVVGGLLALAVAAILGRRRWGRALAIVLEFVFLMVGLLALLVFVLVVALDPTTDLDSSSLVAVLVAVVLPAAACGMLATRSANDWVAG
jgi:drug/metabolite transporter (DMT)-like permease